MNSFYQNRNHFMFAVVSFLILASLPTLSWAAWPFSDEKKKEESKAAVAAAPEPISILPKKEETAKIDTILTTLNQSLEENKKLREEAESFQDQLSRGVIENNVLRSQLRTMQGQIDALRNEVNEKEMKYKKDDENIRQEMERMKEAEKKSQEFREFAQESLNAAETENAKLKRLLNNAILQSERDEYVRLISESEEKAAKAAEELMLAKRQSERMRLELGSAYYNLGNMLAEAADYMGAITQYKKALKLNPNDSWSHYNIAIIYDYHLKESAKALAHYKRYLNVEPAKQELDKVRERVLEIELKDSIIPKHPLKSEYDNYDKKLNKPYLISSKG